VIFDNPAGAPELACNACGCRWFDRMSGACYECGEPVPPEDVQAFHAALAAYQARRGLLPADAAGPIGAGGSGSDAVDAVDAVDATDGAAATRDGRSGAQEHAMQERWFEDYHPGSVHELGSVEVDADEVVHFGRLWDPQPMHTDAEAAARSPFGGLIASGWHTAGLMMRLYAQRYLSPVSSVASPGMEELRWPHAVRPGDRLSVRVTVLDARPSASRPDRGIVRSLIEVRNQDGALVMTMRAANMILRRPQAG
jgi:acyl dehydratase